MHKFVLGWLFVMMVAAGAEFPYPANRIGCVDWLGYPSVWVEQGWRIHLGNGEEVPIRFNFTTKPGGLTSSCLGANWWFPLFESHLVEISENQIQWHAPGGQVLDLQNNFSGDKGLYHTRDERWKAAIVGENDVTIESRDNWVLRYKNGFIHEIVSPRGIHLAFKRSQGLVRNVMLGTRSVITAEYDQENKTLTNLLIGEASAKQLKLEFRMGKFPLLQHALGQGVLTSLTPALESMSANGAEILNCAVQSVTGEEISINLAQIDGTKKAQKDSLTWNQENGVLKRDAISEYHVTPDAVDHRCFKISRTFNDKSLGAEEYTWDGAKGIELHKTKDTITQQIVILSPGPNYGKTRKVLTQKDGIWETLKEYNFSSDGKLIRERGNKLTKTWGPRPHQFRIISSDPKFPLPLGESTFQESEKIIVFTNENSETGRFKYNDANLTEDMQVRDSTTGKQFGFSKGSGDFFQLK